MPTTIALPLSFASWLDEHHEHHEHHEQRRDDQRALLETPFAVPCRARPHAPRQRSLIVLELADPRERRGELALEPDDLLSPLDRTRLMGGVRVELRLEMLT